MGFLNIPEITPDLIIKVLIGMIAFIISGSIHEFGHAASAYVLGDSTAKNNGRMTLNPIAHVSIIGTIVFPLINAISGIPVIGWMKPVPTNPNNFRFPSQGQAITAFMGPFSNFIQLSFTLIVLKIMLSFPGLYKIYVFSLAETGTQSVISYFIFFVFSYFQINFFLMFFNLLPIPPLDGGWIIRHFLPDNLKAGFDKIYRFGMLILLALVMFGIISYLFVPVYFIFSFTMILLSPGVNIVFSFIPLIFSGLILFLFFRKDFINFAQVHKRRAEFNITKKVADIELNKSKSDNTKLYNDIKRVLVALNNDIDLSEKEYKLVEKLETIVKEIDHDAPLCYEADFKTDDQYCVRCENYPKCLLREINILKERIAGLS